VDTKITCVMIIDWETSIGSDLLSNIEQLFERYNLAPYDGAGSVGEKNTQGIYSRVKKRLSSFLEAGNADSVFHDIRVLSEKKYEDALPFCPSALGVAWVSGARKDRKAIFYIRNDFLETEQQFISDVERYFCSHLGEFYGAVFELSADLGPAYYLSSIVTASSQLNFKPSAEYKERITRWRDNINRGNYPRSGFFREIYPKNYITNAHLNKKFKGVDLKNFMEQNGKLEKTSFNPNVYRWDVLDANRNNVQNILEESGIILSSKFVTTAN